MRYWKIIAVVFSLLVFLLIPGSIGYAPASSESDSRENDWEIQDRQGGQILYGVSHFSDVLLTIDPITGEGTEVGPLGIDIGNEGINFHPDGTLYGLFWNNSSMDYRLYAVDLQAGAATEVGPLNLGLAMDATDIAIDSEGRLFGIVGNQVIEIDRFTGEGTIVYQLPSNFHLPGLDFSPDDTLYASGNLAGELVLITIDIQGQSYTVIGNLDYNTHGLCFDESGILYGSAEDPSPDELTIIDVNTAEQTVLGPIGFELVAGIDFSPSFRLEILYLLPYARPGYLTWWKPALINNGDSEVTIDRIRLDLYGPFTTSITLWSGILTVSPGSKIEEWIDLSVPDQVPLGTYILETVAEYQGQDLASGFFECEVVE